MYTKYKVQDHSDETLSRIEEKWELPEREVKDSRAPFHDPMCQPGAMVSLCVEPTGTVLFDEGRKRVRDRKHKADIVLVDACA